MNALQLRQPRPTKRDDLKPDPDAPWFIVNQRTGEAVSMMSPKFGPQWTSNPEEAFPYPNRGAAYSSAWHAKKMKKLDDEVTFMDAKTVIQLHQAAAQAAIDTAKAQADAAQAEIDATKAAAEAADAARIEAAVQAKLAKVDPEVEEEERSDQPQVVSIEQSEYGLQAFQDVVRALEEESAAYEMFLQAKAKLRNAKQKLRVIQESSRQQQGRP